MCEYIIYTVYYLDRFYDIQYRGQLNIEINYNRDQL